ncbi:MAG: hypothetical protein IKB70_06315 [Bacilli bacterium]|nr:hypothetical protein [Bacilli bacterium]
MLRNNLTKDIPADCNLFCLVNYNVSAANSKTGECIDSYPLLNKPLFGRNLDEVKSQLANMFNLPLENLSKWDVIGDDDNFAPSICVELRGILCGEIHVDALYSFDVYTTVNTLNLLY